MAFPFSLSRNSITPVVLLSIVLLLCCCTSQKSGIKAIQSEKLEALSAGYGTGFKNSSVAFHDYITSHYQLPQRLLKEHGHIGVVFTVTPEGNLIDIAIVKGLEQAGEKKELVQLIQSAPQWAPAIQNKNPVPVPMYYRINY